MINIFKADYLPVRRLCNWPKNIIQFFRNFKYMWQRATKGYCDRDVWCMNDHNAQLIHDMLIALADTCHGYPG